MLLKIINISKESKWLLTKVVGDGEIFRTQCSLFCMYICILTMEITNACCWFYLICAAIIIMIIADNTVKIVVSSVVAGVALLVAIFMFQFIRYV